MAAMITARQCKQARSLLKWNIQDICSRTNLSTKRIDQFEKNMLRLAQPENKELKVMFEKHNIRFTDSFEVVLLDEEKKDDAVRKGMSNEEGERYEATEEEQTIDLSAAKRKQEDEEKKKKALSAKPA